MEPNNIEDFVKSTLNQRTIKPSPKARERLITTLNSEPKKKKKLWFRYAVAASIVFFLFFVLGNLILKNENIDQPYPVTFQKETPELKEEKEAVLSNENKIVSGDQPILIYDNKTQRKDTISVLYSDNSRRNISSQSSLKNKEDIPLDGQQDVDHEVGEVLNNYKLQNEDIVLDSKFPKDTTELNPDDGFNYITPENLLATIQSDTSLQLTTGKQKLPDMYVNSNDLLLEMERQLFDEKHKSFFKKAAKRLKKLNEAIAYRNYKD